MEEQEQEILDRLGITINPRGKYGEMTKEQIEAKVLIIDYFRKGEI